MEVGAVELVPCPLQTSQVFCHRRHHSPPDPWTWECQSLAPGWLGTRWHVAEAKATCQRWMDSVAARAIIALGQCTTILCDSYTKVFANQNGTRMRRMRRMSLSKMESSTGHLWTSLLWLRDAVRCSEVERSFGWMLSGKVLIARALTVAMQRKNILY